MTHPTQTTQTKWIARCGWHTAIYCGDETHGELIADCHPKGCTLDRGQAQANAVLMAAAPDLLAALKALETRGHTAATWQAAKAAIAKAEKPYCNTDG
tara:strand:- start:150 stop:443 length:294 start_codon:yes stop_codon:yes gene_type:complete